MILGVYLEGRYDSVHVVIYRVLVADVCMYLFGIGPVRALVGEVAKLLAPEALELAKVLRLSLAIFGVHLAVVRVVVIIVCKDNGAWRRTYRP